MLPVARAVPVPAAPIPVPGTTAGGDLWCAQGWVVMFWEAVGVTSPPIQAFPPKHCFQPLSGWDDVLLPALGSSIPQKQNALGKLRLCRDLSKKWSSRERMEILPF